MELKRPEFPAWPAWVGIACFTLMVLIVLDQRPRPVEPREVDLAGVVDDAVGTVITAGIPISSGTGEVVLGVTPDLPKMDQDGYVILSQQSEDRIVRRLQQFLDRNEADRPLPVFGAK